MIGPRWLAFAIMAGGLLLASGCATNQQLMDENAQLRNDLESLQARYDSLKEKLDEGFEPGDLTEVRAFNVGLAAAEATFDDQAFLDLLMQSLKSGARSPQFRVSREGDPGEINKIRGMLVQQYLAAEEVPITISNLAYKVQDPERAFKIGGRVVPRGEARIARASSNAAVHMNLDAPLQATMVREPSGRFSIAYEELGGGSGRIPIGIDDSQIQNTQEEPQFARQGDISFNWNLNLAKVVVYRIEGYEGDVGEFLRTMRYPDVRSTISQYQTLRDFVFLFGYGNYQTELVNQIRTPTFISSVEVMAIEPSAYALLKGGMSEEDLLGAAGRGGRWVPCEFVDFDGDKRIWSRPPEIQFPFISRQVSEKKRLIFYNKYNSGGAQLIGDFEHAGTLTR